AELGGQNQDLAAGQVDVDGFRDVTVRQGSRLGPLLVVDEDAEDDAAQRPGALVDTDEGLESAVSRLDPVGQQGTALGADTPVIRLADQLEGMAVDRPIGPERARRPDERDILNTRRL